MGDLEKANKSLHYVKGTKLESLTQSISKNNKTGIKGICIRRVENKIYYRASIQLAKIREEKSFNNLQDAINWRKEKEYELYKPLLDNYNIDFEKKVEEK